MKTYEPAIILTERMVVRTIARIREDDVLGDETSSWSTVAPTEWEATDRLRMLVETGVVSVVTVTPSGIVSALREFERGFLSVG